VAGLSEVKSGAGLPSCTAFPDLASLNPGYDHVEAGTER
jgi:hypothetical protein